MSVLGFPASAAARNFQDLSHIFRDFRRPVPLSFARMEIVSRTAPRPVGLMRVAGLTPLVACLGRDGAPLTRLLQRVRLPARLFDRPEALIPTCQAARFIDEAASVEGFENVALVAGQGTPLEALGVFGRLVRRERTLHEALDTAIRNMPAFDSGSRWWLERQGGRARLCHELVDAIDGERRQAREYRSSLAMKLIGLAAGPSDDIQRREAAVSFPVSLLGRAVPPLSGQRTDDDIAAWEASAPAADFPGSVLQVIETLSFAHQARIGLVADAIGISVRALQRRLAEAGATFAGLIAHERFATAIGLLEETDSTILDIALNLGYSDHAHFTRAFRRWTGVPPREFRRMTQSARRNALRQDSLPLGRAANG